MSNRHTQRYYIAAVTGYAITGISTQGGSYDPSTVYSILDRFMAHREVRRFTPAGSRSRARCRELVREECNRMNADEREWERGLGEYAA